MNKREQIIKRLKIELDNLNKKHDIMVAALTYLNTEVELLLQELKTDGKENK